MSEQTETQVVEALVVHFKSGTTARANVVPGSVKVDYVDAAGRLRSLAWESIPTEDQLLYVNLDQVNAVVIERWEHPTTDTKDGDYDE